MAVKAYALTTLARLKTYGDININDDNTLLESIIDACTSWVETYCKRRFQLTTYTNEKMDSDGSEMLFLDQYPIDEATGLTLDIRTSGQNKDRWESINSGDYYVDYGAGIIYSIDQSKWQKAVQRYRATYKAGYDFNTSTKPLSDTVIGDLEIAVWKMCLTVYNKRRGDADVVRESIGKYSVEFARAAFEDDPFIGGILNKYRKADEVIGGMTPKLYS